MVRPFASPSPTSHAKTWYGHLDLPSVTSTPQSKGGVISSHSVLTAARAASQEQHWSKLLVHLWASHPREGHATACDGRRIQAVIASAEQR
jgi:hypothetical protein